LQTNEEGNVIPVEVKSSKRTRVKSLQSYITKYAPEKTYIYLLATALF
jgi:hypothetical protein